MRSSASIGEIANRVYANQFDIAAVATDDDLHGEGTPGVLPLHGCVRALLQTSLGARWHSAFTPIVVGVLGVLTACSNEPSTAPAPPDSGPTEDGATGAADAAVDARDAAPPAKLEPGVCYGESTECGPVDSSTVTPADEMTVECEEGAAMQIAWSTALASVTCRLGDCPLANPTVALSGDQSWALAEVREPAQNEPFGSTSVGQSILRFDADGAATIATTELRSMVEGPLPPQYTQGLGGSPEGGLWWLAQSGAGFGTRAFSASGEEVHHEDLVDDAYYGHGVWDDEDQLTVAYRYEDPDNPNASPEALRLFPGVARFSATGPCCGIRPPSTPRSAMMTRSSPC